MKYPSLSLLLSGFIIAYILYSVYTISLLFVPPTCSQNEKCLYSYLSDNPPLQIHLFTSMKGIPNSGAEVNKLSSDVLDYQTANDRQLQLSIPWRVRQNGTFYLHIFITNLVAQDQTWNSLTQNRKSSYCKILLTQYHIPELTVFNLINDKKLSKQEQELHRQELKPVSHLKSKVMFNILTENITFPYKNLPPELAKLLIVTPQSKYLPIVVHNFLETRIEDLKQMKNETDVVLLKYSPITIGKLRLVLHLEAALLSLRHMGFSPKDVDDLKNIFAGTNFYLLTVTIVIASFHLLFDFLAFKNDVSFWRRKSNLEGLSSRTVMWRGFSQSVVFLYLLDEGSSMLVLVPSGIGAIIELWKVVKVLNRRKCSETSAVERETDKYDAESMKYLSYLLYPLCASGAVYSLFYQPHKSWYSWCINSLVNGVYAFGFLFMLPQLFVNYRLKSVAALPWKAFMYKAFNTFIDDVFAFIITMPTAHRVACFRDDLVFLVYLYQRWLYPVDTTRVDESARALSGSETANKEKKEQ